MRLARPLALSLTPLLLTACLDLSSGSDDDVVKKQDDTTTEPSVQLSGKVADGYLSGARVCLDINKNKVCDPDEPSTLSTDGGNYNFDNVTQAQINSAPLLVEIIVGSTVDEDSPGVAIDKKYTLTAPPGFKFVSPLTTMVQSEAEDKGIPVDQAKGAVQAKLGTTLDLEEDYVEGAKDEVSGAEFKRLHKVAQVTTVILQKNIEVVEKVLAESEVSFDDLVGVIVKQVIDTLDTISTQVKNDTDANFDPTKLAESDGLKKANVEAAKVEEQIEERKTERALEVASVAKILTDGGMIHFFETRHDSNSPTRSFEYGTVSKSQNADVTTTRTRYSKAGGWQPVTETNDENRAQFILTANGFSKIDDSREKITIDGDKVIVVKGGVADTRREITGVSASLDGKRILSFMKEEYNLAVNPVTDFSTNAVGYKLRFVRTNPLFALFLDQKQNVSDCWDGKAEVGQPWNPTDTFCNNVFLRDGDPNTNNDGAAATTLAQLISTSAAVNPKKPEDIKGTPMNGRDLEVMLELVEGGVANYYLIDQVPIAGGGDLPQKERPVPVEEKPEPPKAEEDKNPTDAEKQDDEKQVPPEAAKQTQFALNASATERRVTKKIVASWKMETINGQLILRFVLPPVIAELGHFKNEERQQFFAVYESYVRRGGIEPAGQRGDGEWVFNDAAKDQILAAFDISLLDGLTQCKTGDVSTQKDAVGVESGGATLATFKTLVQGCVAQVVTAQQLTRLTLVTDFGFLTFKSGGKGTFLGEVGDNKKAVLEFSWNITSDNLVVINTNSTEDGKTRFLRLTFAIIARNAREMSIKSFMQEADTAAALDGTNGEVESNMWGRN